MSTLSASHLSLQYGSNKSIIHDLSLTLQQGKIYSIIGPNGCGKSTLLKALARQLTPKEGRVELMGADIFRMPQKQVARALSYLAQWQETVDVQVRDLVSYGRTPYHSIMRRYDPEDGAIIDWALRSTSLQHMSARKLNSLSGGERQRAWIAMSLAQQPEYLLLDEPTTYLDVGHQMEVLELVQQVNRQRGTTIVMVLHDMNHACQFSDQVIVMKDGAVYDQGEPCKVVTSDLVREVFQVRATIVHDDETGKPICWIKGRQCE